MKFMVISLIFLIFFFSFAKAISITEFESDPPGSDAGHEWVELYSSSDYNLDNYYLLNNDGKSFNLSGTFSGYKVIEFPKQFLDNSDESLQLKKLNDSNIIDSTDIFKDDKNNDLAWALCTSEWKFIASSKGKENSCAPEEDSDAPQNDSASEDTIPEAPEETASPLDSTNDSDSSSQSSQNSSQPVTLQPQTQQTQPSSNKIILTSKAITDKDSKSTQVKPQSSSQSFITKEGIYQLWLPIAFSFLCLVIIILIIIKKL